MRGASGTGLTSADLVGSARRSQGERRVKSWLESARHLSQDVLLVPIVVTDTS